MNLTSCSLCLKESVIFHTHCDVCEEIKNIIAVYGHKDVLKILNTVCIRNKIQQDHKINKEMKIETKK